MYGVDKKKVTIVAAKMLSTNIFYIFRKIEDGRTYTSDKNPLLGQTIFGNLHKKITKFSYRFIFNDL